MNETKRPYLEIFPEEREKIIGESHFLMMTLPSIFEVGERVPLKVVMMDTAGMPDEGFEGTIDITPSAPGLEVPDQITFEKSDLGRKAIPGIEATETGTFFLEAEVQGTPSRPVPSNPVNVKEDAKTRLYWGDIHVHTFFSNCHRDCAKDPSFGYWYGREVSHLDFAAAADHLRGLSAERWARTKEINEEYNADGEFATILGFESSHSKDHGGDINVYYRGGDPGYFWLDREDMKGINPQVGLDVLWSWLDDQGEPYLTIPHHTGRAAKYRNFELPYYNRERETLLEIYSMWGSSEARDDDYFLRGGKTDQRAYFQDALELGYRYGLIGSSDNHHTMPGTPFSMLPVPYHHPPNKMISQGLAAVYATKLTRASIFDSLLQRRCYATTSTRPILNIALNETPMGQTLEMINGTRRLVVELSSSLLPVSIEIFRNNEVMETHRAEKPFTRIVIEDNTDLNDLWIIGSPKNPKPFIFYYVRLIFSGVSNGISAWSSPVWVEKP
ncbi:MAG: DUF3604 domain-containing protein [Theionarchaea archaeon]|nr:DUF3604 domain-containing protein [Theionarchaea archaeon]